MEPTKICENCGKIYKGEICPKCGAYMLSIEEKEEIEQKYQKKKDKRDKIKFSLIKFSVKHY